MIHEFASWLVYHIIGMDPASHWGRSVHFFVYDTIKITLLLLAMTFLMGVVNSYMPVEKVRARLASRRWFGLDHLMAAVFGAITPFCSCSSIPLFIGFVRGGIPLGVTFSFLITSPLVNEAAVAVFIGVFGWRTTLLYCVAGITVGTIVGGVLGRLRLERHVEDWVWNSKVAAGDAPMEHRTFRDRLPGIVREALATTKKVMPYVLVGIAIGAAMHGFVPAGYFERYISRDNPLAVPAAVVLGVPMYANATGVIPVIEQLVEKGIPLGTALAFMMAVVGLSIPEGLLLRRVLKPRLIIIFFASVSMAIAALGYFFNAVFG
ncbi:MAG: permease [Phycisphaerales bacterium]